MRSFIATMKTSMICLLNLSVYAQDLTHLYLPTTYYGASDGRDLVELISTETFAGVSLSEFHEIPLQFAFFSPMRYQPDLDDIRQAEQILSKELKKLCARFHGKNSAIHRHLHRYIRQYVGLTNHHGDRLILINALWKNKVKNYPWESRFINILHGGSLFWRTRINLDRGKVELFLVNSDCLTSKRHHPISE